MSMTESEALEWFKGFYNGDCEREDFEDTICADCNFPCRHGIPILRAISALEEVQQYRAIGTVSELRELKEKATAKKPIVEEVCKVNYSCKTYRCPTCKQKLISKIDGSWCGGTLSKYCEECGTVIDWSEGKE